jgi:gluconate 5-dehydrogenase
MEWDLKGKVAIVTTDTEQEGVTSAEGLLRAGATVSVWDPDPKDLEFARRELEASGLRAEYRLVDLTRLEEVQAAYEAVRAELGEVDVLVNHATLRNPFMMGTPDPVTSMRVNFWELDVDRFRHLIDVNIMGMYYCARVVAAGMVARGRGSIMTHSTSDATKTTPYNQPYGASKAFVEAFCAAAAEGLKPHGVRCNVFSSGGRTNRRGVFDPTAMSYDCMVPVICYLASDASREVTGQVLAPQTFTPPG